MSTHLISIAVLMGIVFSFVNEPATALEKKQIQSPDTALFRKLDKTKDSKLTRGEIGGGQLKSFERLLSVGDASHHGKLSRAEFLRTFSKPKQNRSAPKRKPQPVDPQQVFRDLDRNKDGKLELREIPDARKPFIRDLLKQAKKKEDGSLTREEAVPLIAKALQANQQVVAFIGRYDKNKDRRISKKEAPQRLKERFDRLDVDNNGYLVYSEIGRFVTDRIRKRPASKKDSVKKKTNRKKARNKKTNRNKARKKNTNRKKARKKKTGRRNRKKNTKRKTGKKRNRKQKNKRRRKKKV